MHRLLPLVFAVFLGFNCDSQELDVMSYNIKYANENDGENSWSKRKDFLINQIKFYDPDILGVQEAVPQQMQYLDSIFPVYKYVGVGRDGGQNGEYSAIFFKPEKLELLAADTFWLSTTPAKPSRGWDAALNRICTYARFKNRATGKDFYVFNTHFDHKGEIAREQSARLILEKIASINQDELPLILMGDLNLEPTSKPVELLLQKLHDAREQAVLVSFGSEATFNAYNFNEAPARRIDYILINEKVRVLKFATLTDSKDQRYPSDHFPVFAKISLE